ncbi:MAG TPA: CHASE2 domain-containing protein [Myxococcaceae bacterium]|nr:CHASE2 domain-containing protein [Myxococcaceae bacterium]
MSAPLSFRVLRLRLAQHGWRVLALAAFATAAAWVCHERGWLRIHEIEQQAYDQGLRLYAGDRPRSEQVVLLGIDDATLQGIRQNESYARSFGNYPYQRHLWAQIFTHLMEEGARAIVFDAVMDERASDEGNDWQFAEAIRSQNLPLSLGFTVVAGRAPLPAVEAVNRLPLPTPAASAASRHRAPDDVFASEVGAEVEQATALEGFVEAEGLGEHLEGFVEANGSEAQLEGFVDVADVGSASTEIVPSDAGAGLLRKAAAALAFPVTTEGLTLPSLEVLRAHGEAHSQNPVPPIPLLLEDVPAFGLVLMEEDPDGVLRRTRFAYRGVHNAYVTLPVAAAADLFEASSLHLEPGLLSLGERRIPVNADGTAELDYGGPWEQRFRAYSVLAALEDSVRKAQARESSNTAEVAWDRVIPEGAFRDRVVVVGGMSVGTADVRATPFGSQVPGFVKQATVLEGLLETGFITRTPLWVDLLITFLLSLLSVTLILTTRWTPLEVLWPVALFFGFFLVTGVFLRHGQVHLLTAMPVYAGELASLCAVAMNHLFASRDREHLRAAFSRYLTPSLVDELVEQNRLPTLDGESREISAFFSDIRGFSSFSERYQNDPQGLVRILNRYLTRVSEVLLEQGACLDKYIGDAVVCLFGAPVAMEDHALRACRGALAVREAVTALREEFAAEGLPDVYTRIGVNSAVMFVGNFGSSQLLDYTAIGDGMNLAARLEGANKHYGTLIMIGQRTRELAGDRIEVRELDAVRVAGKSEAVVVYELLALAGEASEAQRDAARRYEEALRLWRDQHFAEAGVALEALLQDHPHDGPSATLLERTREHLARPPVPFDPVVDLGK